MEQIDQCLAGTGGQGPDPRKYHVCFVWNDRWVAMRICGCRVLVGQPPQGFQNKLPGESDVRFPNISIIHFIM